MGVKGLSSFMETHRRIYQDVRFGRRRLVIDGSNLLYHLYFSSGLDQNHGGEYAAFEEVVEKFIAALRTCEVSPYVVLDGGSDITDKKLVTLRQRAADRIRKAHQAAVEGKQNGILPQLVKLVFTQTLDRLEVPLARCYQEADREIAALANEWQSPVLSRDSDFYVFDLPAGLLPISEFRWEALERSGSRSYVPCKKYSTSSFCVFFNIQPRLLPVLGALAGNDYVKPRKESSVSWAQFAPAGGEEPTHLRGLLCWLGRFQEPPEALEAALELMAAPSEEEKEEVRKDLYLGMKEYELPASCLKMFFIHETAPPFPAEVAGLVPDWIHLPLTQGRLTPDTLDVLLLQRMHLGFPVEDANMPSAHLASRPLRQLMYGLLLGRDRTQNRPAEVQEWDREGLELTFTPVRPTFTAVTQQLLLSSLDQVALGWRLQVLLEALGVSEGALSRVPPRLRLPVAVTRYWWRQAAPAPDQRLLKALLLGLIAGSGSGAASRSRAALHIQKTRPKEDPSVSHAFVQWQACLKDSIHLNQLLGFPLPEPQVSRLYEGTRVHLQVHQMTTGNLTSVLEHRPSQEDLYQTMLAVVHPCHAGEASEPSETRSGRPAPRVRTADPQQWHGDEEAGEAGDEIRALQDLRLEEQVSVRTRHRKEGKKPSSDPVLVRKVERRGPDQF